MNRRSVFLLLLGCACGRLDGESSGRRVEPTPVTLGHRDPPATNRPRVAHVVYDWPLQYTGWTGVKVPEHDCAAWRFEPAGEGRRGRIVAVICIPYTSGTEPLSSSDARLRTEWTENTYVVAAVEREKDVVNGRVQVERFDARGVTPILELIFDAVPLGDAREVLAESLAADLGPGSEPSSLLALQYSARSAWLHRKGSPGRARITAEFLIK